MVSICSFVVGRRCDLFRFVRARSCLFRKNVFARTRSFFFEAADTDEGKPGFGKHVGDSRAGRTTLAGSSHAFACGF